MTHRSLPWPALGAGPVVLPSILSADFSRLGEAIAEVERAGAQGLHLDVMDGHFVPNITFGPPLVKSVRGASRAVLDCHLMIEEPVRYVRAFHEAGADLVSVHAELFADPRPAVQAIRNQGLKVGLALNPDTPLSRVVPALPEIDLLLLMSVFPGFGGQRFRPEVIDKIRSANEIRVSEGMRFAIEVDGGVDGGNVASLVALGVDLLVAGQAIFGTKDPAEAYRALSEAALAARV